MRLYAAATGTVSTAKLSLSHVIWQGCTTAGHGFSLRDSAENVVFVATNGVADEPRQYQINMVVDGLEVAGLDSGNLQIYANEVWGQ